jgi:hypothetical protein
LEFRQNQLGGWLFSSTRHLPADDRSTAATTATFHRFTLTQLPQFGLKSTIRSAY